MAEKIAQNLFITLNPLYLPKKIQSLASTMDPFEQQIEMMDIVFSRYAPHSQLIIIGCGSSAGKNASPNPTWIPN
jgi:hypothetical protein